MLSLFSKKKSASTKSPVLAPSVAHNNKKYWLDSGLISFLNIASECYGFLESVAVDSASNDDSQAFIFFKILFSFLFI